MSDRSTMKIVREFRLPQRESRKFRRVLGHTPIKYLPCVLFSGGYNLWPAWRRVLQCFWPVVSEIGFTVSGGSIKQESHIADSRREGARYARSKKGSEPSTTGAVRGAVVDWKSEPGTRRPQNGRIPLSTIFPLAACSSFSPR